MGKFDGYLICSDLDGTFRSGEDTVAINAEAVRYFTKNGGTFTFATGRSVEHLRESALLECMNAPASLCNGAVVYDYQTEQVLREKRVPFSFGEFLSELSQINPPLKAIALFQSVFEESVWIGDLANVSEELLSQNPLKIVCVFEAEEEANKVQNQMKEMPLFQECSILKSWPVGVEINSNRATKGDTVQFLKETLEGIHTTIGVGNYENDIPLLTHADLGAAPENSLPSVLKTAQWILKRSDEYAIKDLIERLEQRIGK